MSLPLLLQEYLGQPDYRVSSLPLLSSPKWFLSTCVIYFSVIKIGNKIMRNRAPFSLKRVLKVFNIFQVLLSFYILKEVFISAVKMKYSCICQPLDAGNVTSLRMAYAFWLFYVSKYIDLLDTLFFVLKKKTHQLSFLHMYHHSTMLFNWYLGVLYLPGGQAFISVLANCFVHVIMYSYYFLSTMGPKVQKYLWWKKYLTQLQLVQFFIIIFHVSLGLITRCSLPKWLAWFTILYLFTLIALFLNFYQKAYKKSSAKRTTPSNIDTTSPIINTKINKLYNNKKYDE